MLVTLVASYLLGPFGIIVGLAVLFLADGVGGKASARRGFGQANGYGGYTTGYGAAIGNPILVLLAAVMRADGRVMRSEVEYTRNLLTQLYGSARTQQAMIELRDLLKTALPLRQACAMIALQYSYADRQRIMRALFELAQADGNLVPSELQLLAQIAQMLNVAQQEYSRMHTDYESHQVDYYGVLGLTSKATNEEIRQAYKKLALRWHPDRVDQTDAKAHREATQRFQKINEAYEKIRKQRGMK